MGWVGWGGVNKLFCHLSGVGGMSDEIGRVVKILVTH